MSINKPAKILLLSAPIGAGHTRAAEAVASAIIQKCERAECRIIDVFEFLPSWIGKGILAVYFSVLRTFPQLYARAYGWGNDSVLALWGRDLISRYFARQMRAYFNIFKPDIIVCTHATPAGLTAYMRRAGLLDVPLVGIVTDYVVHRLWVYPEIDQYCIAHDNMRAIFECHGIARDKIAITGIPVHPDFRLVDIDEKKSIAQRLNLRTDLPTIMVMGGGAGLLPVESILTAFEDIETPMQIIIITGHNIKLADRLCSRREHFRHSMVVLGFTSNIPEYMAVSDLLISKPGGMTVSEALSMGLPLLVFQPLPGQEEANAKFLVDHQLAVRADSPEEVVHCSHQLFSQADGWSHYEKNALLHGRKRAADEVADCILSLLRHMS